VQQAMHKLRVGTVAELVELLKVADDGG